LTYGRKNLKLNFMRGYAIPLYLDSKSHRGLLEATIAFYETNLGKPYGSIDWEELRMIIGDDRLYEALRKVMSIFYKPKAPTIKPIVNPKSLRLKVFQLVNERYGGFIPSHLREKALKEIAEELKLNVSIDEVLWCDDVNELPLMRVRKANIESVIKAFNYETLDTVCVNSSKIVIETSRHEGGLGKLARSIGRYCKLYGLVYYIKYTNDKLRIIIEGPCSLFGKPTRYGNRLSLLLVRILPRLYGMRLWSVDATMHTRTGRTIPIRLLSNDIRPELGVTGEVKVREVYDSSVEESIYRVLKSLGVNIIREEEPIALGDLLYLPDFKIYSPKGIFYLEVAGYWRREYAEKKAYKLHEVSKVFKNIILVADEKLKPYFNKLKIPVIYYRISYGKPILPYNKILKIIK